MLPPWRNDCLLPYTVFHESADDRVQLTVTSALSSLAKACAVKLYQIDDVGLLI